MTTGAWRTIGLVAAAVAIGIVVGLAVLMRGGEETSLAPPLEGDAIAVTATMKPRTHLFFDPVTAQLDLVFDRRTVREESVRVTSGFEPYTTDGDGELQRTQSGDLVRLRYRWTLRCETQDCLPQGSSSTFDFRLARLDFVLVGHGRSAQPFAWPSIESTSRVGTFDVERAQWRANARTVPEVTYRLSPGVLGATLLGAAVILLVAAGAVAWQLVPRRAPAEAAAEEERRLSAIERALEAAIFASSNGSTAEQRKALERLARELGAEGLDELTQRTRRLAWSQTPPTQSDVESLAADVRRTVGGAA